MPLPPALLAVTTCPASTCPTFRCSLGKQARQSGGCIGVMSLPSAGLAALVHCELAVGVRLPGATAPWTTLHVPVGIALHRTSRTMHCGKREVWL